MGRLLSREHMNQVSLDVAFQLKHNVTNYALMQFLKDLPTLGKIPIPSGWVFVWDSETGERKCFFGTIDPL